MLNNYLKVAYRNLVNSKAYSLINISGLAIGLACFILILVYVLHESSYDRYHPNAERIFRITTEIQATSGMQHTAQSAPVWARLFPEDMPEIDMSVRLKPPRQTWMVTNEEKDLNFSEKRFAFADSNVFKMFHLPLLSGNPETALEGPDKLVISEAAARKYFGKEDPMGKNLLLDNQYLLAITGVMQNMPENSHFHFDFLASFESLKDSARYYLSNVPELPFPFAYTYVRLEKASDRASVEARFPQFIEKHLPSQFNTGATRMRAFLQPLTEIHLKSNLENEIEPTGNGKTIFIFISIAVFILLIACVNFMNLATARSAKRAKEVGMRKAMGAYQSHITYQFLGETLLLAIISLVISYGLAYAGLSFFNQVSGKSFIIGDLVDPLIITMVAGVTIVVGLVSGSYPAMVLASIRPSEVLKSAQKSGTGGHSLLRQVLIVLQFAISIFLVIGTLVVYNQMKYARNIDSGLDKEQVLVLQLTDPTPMALYRTYKKEIMSDPTVSSVSASFSAPGSLVQQGNLQLVNSGSDETWQIHSYFADFDFVETLGIDLLAGRTIVPENPGDTLNGILINETAVQAFGWESNNAALNREIQFVGASNPHRVVGVVKDFHSLSIRERISPTVIGYFNSGFFAFVRIKLDDIPGTIRWLEQKWNEVIPGYTFDYAFLDEDFEELYQEEAVLNQLLTFFAGLAIFIACLGLLGLTSFTTSQRAKEIGIRKVMGSSVARIIVLLTVDFTRLVLIGFLIGAPVAWFVMDGWLDNFAYRTHINPLILLLACVFSLVAALFTVGFQTYKAATVNPAVSLRNE